MLWDEPKIFFLERRYFFSIILSEFLKNRVALQEQRLKHHLTLEQVAEKADLSANYIGMVERGLKEPGLATIVKILNALNISADELLCDLVPSASHVTDDEISKRLEGLTPMQKKVALDLLDTYITNLPYLTKEE